MNYKELNKEELQYAVGGILYMPAIRKDIAKIITSKKYKDLMSVAICLEDSISDDAVADAEKQLLNTFIELDTEMKKESSDFSLRDKPLIFIRCRNYKHMVHIWKLVKEYESLFEGFLLPKFDTTNMCEYKEAIIKINSESNEIKYILPILESKQLIDIRTRVTCLGQIKEELREIKDYVLNIRVGGNDFCNQYGLRRTVNQTIYDIAVVSGALCDIVNVFGRSYIISGPVWEYFANEKDSENMAWKFGLEKELAQDRVNGFIGKTCIHPSQLPYIKESLKVWNGDLLDAKEIIERSYGKLGVAKSNNGSRMNEIKTHINWAKKIITLAKIYGTK